MIVGPVCDEKVDSSSGDGGSVPGQLAGTGVELVKLSGVGATAHVEWLATHLKSGDAVAGDGNVPVEYATTSGRTADLATVQENMDRLCRLLQRRGYPIDQVVIIGDRGTLNDEIALKYDAKGLKYLAGLKVQKKEHVELLKAVPEAQLRAHPLTAARGRYGTYCLACTVTFTHAGRSVTHRGLVVIAGPMCPAARQARAQALRALRTDLAAVRAKIGGKRCRSLKAVQARADTSGGAAFTVSDFAGLRRAALQVVGELKHQYRLGYDPPPGPARGASP